MSATTASLRATMRLAWWLARGNHLRLWLLIACIAIGTSARVGVGALTDLVDRAMAMQSRPMLGADLEIASYQPLSARQREQLQAALPSGARQLDQNTFVTMAQAPSTARAAAVEIHAVPIGYPLVGQVSIEPSGGPPATSSAAALFSPIAPGVYVERTLLSRLGVQLGAQLRLGSTSFTIAGVLREEPGLGQNPFAVGPRVVMGIDALPGTGLAAAGSRIRHITLVATPDPLQATDLEHELRRRWGLLDNAQNEGLARPGDELGISMRTAQHAQESLVRAFERLGDYLHLVTVIALLLGGLGVAVLMHSFIDQQREVIVVIQILGATTRGLALIFLLYALAIGVVGGALGVAAGLGAAHAVSGLLPGDLAAAQASWLDLRQIGWGMALASAISLTFAALPLIAFSRSRPQERARGELRSRRSWVLLSGIIVLVVGVITAVAAHEVDSWQIGSLFIVALTISGLLIYGLGVLGAGLAARLRPPGFALRYGLANLARPGLWTSTAIVAIGVSCMLFGVLAIYQYSLAHELGPRPQHELPSLFLIDIQSDQLDELRTMLHQDFAIDGVELSPRLRARFRGVLRHHPDGTSELDPGRGARNREQNLSWRTTLGGAERIVAGRWIDDAASRVEASLEQRYASNLKATLGDVLSFDIQGVRLEATVTSIRSVQWTSFRPNFFVLLSPHALREAPQSWVAALPALPPAQRDQVLNRLAQRFPTITVFDLSEVGQRINQIIGRIADVVRLVALSCVAAGLVVLAGLALAAGRTRRADAALLKVLGAGSSQVLGALAVEVVAVGVIAALTGVVLATPITWMLMRLLSLPLAFPWLQAATLMVAAVGISLLAGLISCVSVLSSTPLAVLRDE